MRRVFGYTIGVWNTGISNGQREETRPRRASRYGHGNGYWTVWRSINRKPIARYAGDALSEWKIFDPIKEFEPSMAKL